MEEKPQIVQGFDRNIVFTDIKNKFIKEYEDTEETKYDGDLNFTEIITKLKKERATEYNPWFYVGVALINLYHRKIFTRGQLMDIYDLFSSKSDGYSSDGVIKMLDIIIRTINNHIFEGDGFVVFLTIFFKAVQQILNAIALTIKSRDVDIINIDQTPP